MPRGRTTLLLAASVASWSPPLLAQVSAQPIRVTFEAAPGCSGQEDFVRALLARTELARLAGAEEAARSLSVRVTVTPEGAQGSVTLESSDGPPTVRTLDGESCTDVVTALALAAALAIEGDRGAPDVAMPSTPAQPSRSARSAAGEPPRTSRREPPSAVAPRVWWFGLQGAMAGGVAPDTKFGPALFAQLSFPRARLSTRLTLLHLVDAQSGGAPAGVHAYLSAARLEGCHQGWERGSIRLFPCAGLAGGYLSTSGAVSRSTHAHSPWWEAGAFAHLQLGSGSRFWIDGQAGLVVPLRRYTFAFENPHTIVYETPAIAGALAIGLGIQIP